MSTTICSYKGFFNVHFKTIKFLSYSWKFILRQENSRNFFAFFERIPWFILQSKNLSNLYWISYSASSWQILRMFSEYFLRHKKCKPKFFVVFKESGSGYAWYQRDQAPVFLHSSYPWELHLSQHCEPVLCLPCVGSWLVPLVTLSHIPLRNIQEGKGSFWVLLVKVGLGIHIKSDKTSILLSLAFALLLAQVSYGGHFAHDFDPIKIFVPDDEICFF